MCRVGVANSRRELFIAPTNMVLGNTYTDLSEAEMKDMGITRLERILPDSVLRTINMATAHLIRIRIDEHFAQAGDLRKSWQLGCMLADKVVRDPHLFSRCACLHEQEQINLRVCDSCSEDKICASTTLVSIRGVPHRLCSKCSQMFGPSPNPRSRLKHLVSNLIYSERRRDSSAKKKAEIEAIWVQLESNFYNFG